MVTGNQKVVARLQCQIKSVESKQRKGVVLFNTRDYTTESQGLPRKIKYSDVSSLHEPLIQNQNVVMSFVL